MHCDFRSANNVRFRRRFRSSLIDGDCSQWSDDAAAGSSAQNASECVAEITVEDRVDECVGGVRQK